MTKDTIEVIVLVVLLLTIALLLLRNRDLRATSKFYWKRWDYFEGEYQKVYAAWIKKLSPDELKRVQQRTLDAGKKGYELEEPLNKPI